MDPFPYHIRKIDPDKDAAAVAVLIKTCFRPWLDIENIDYLKSLREAGEEALAHPLWAKFTGFPYLLPGVVCVDHAGNIVGVVNTYDFFHNHYKCSLISNVCVDAAHRKKGIAGRMIKEAEKFLRDDQVYGLYLQARMENADVFNFYRHYGFSVTDFRETWILPSGQRHDAENPGRFSLKTVLSSDADAFEKNFRNRYPESILWNLDYSAEVFRTGTFVSFLSGLDASGNRFRRVTDTDGTLKAWAAVQRMKGKMDQFWFVPNGNLPEDEEGEILKFLAGEFRRGKALKLDVPFGAAAGIFKDAGFVKLHTLAWMWKKL